MRYELPSWLLASIGPGGIEIRWPDSGPGWRRPASIGPGGIEMRAAWSAGGATAAASIGPGGIEMGGRGRDQHQRWEHQLDQVELKFLVGALLARLVVASIGPGGIEMVHPAHFLGPAQVHQLDQVELKWVGAAVLGDDAAGINWTRWN